MKKMYSLLALFCREINLPGHKIAHKIKKSFSRVEQIIFYILFFVLVTSTVVLLFCINQAFLVKVPKEGGFIIEGVVGVPQTINPVTTNPFTSPEVDNGLVALIYSGLLKATPTGTLIPDLAKDYTISEDGLVYTFTLKDNLSWHDDEPITSDDVSFTIQKAQDPKIDSKYKANWVGTTVTTPDKKTVIFTLSEPYSPFLQNTTIGILPKHLWKNVSSDTFEHNRLNTIPIGSGPYKISKIKKHGDDTIEYYDLIAFENYAMGKPYIKKIRVQFFTDESVLLEAYKKGGVTNTNSIPPKTAEDLAKDYPYQLARLPRVFGVFFNQNEAKIFADKTVREALNLTVNKKEIIDEIFYGFATEIDGPIPPGALGFMAHTEETPLTLTTDERLEGARKLLKDSGWSPNEEGVLTKKTTDGVQTLKFSISTTQTSELFAVAYKLKESWEKLGAKVDMKFFETTNDLKDHAIRQRKYDILLFGEIIGRDSDPFAFWHSSGRLDPGLNVALYTNIAVDKALELARATTSTEARIKQYEIVQKEIAKDIPAVFIYSPKFIYFTRNNIMKLYLHTLNTPSERFLNVHEWFIETEQIWKIFARDKEIL
ncbi:hypothetical protein KKH46_03280 [Patescibacteria group bacterium]|nr:hypothetical protein [Patescibacteria group bacterium]MBU1730528.1 hypothetical protein [Patescibacteria group bacterium]MBU1956097.1 hypothetical protein [Patescibacteria group bacterium]